MRLLTTSAGISVAAPAKLNLFLELLGKRPDGYHDLATLMVGLSLADAVEFADAAAGEVRLICDREGLSTGEDNLIVKAARRLQACAGVGRGATIRLVKRIPMAAGLAGGSTDAAATLLGLNRLWKLDLSRGDLTELAAELGSDVAFFLSLPAAWCTGRGEIVEPLAAPRAYDVVLIFPPFGCDTAAVYRHAVVPATPSAGDEVRRAFMAGDLEGLARALHNRLERAAEAVAPQLRPLMEAVARAAPLGCRMSGSGSTLFALTRSSAEAADLVDRLKASPELAGCSLQAVQTLT